LRGYWGRKRDGLADDLRRLALALRGPARATGSAYLERWRAALAEGADRVAAVKVSATMDAEEIEALKWEFEGMVEKPQGEAELSDIAVALESQTFAAWATALEDNLNGYVEATFEILGHLAEAVAVFDPPDPDDEEAREAFEERARDGDLEADAEAGETEARDGWEQAAASWAEARDAVL
jgi:hypothetical protein